MFKTLKNVGGGLAIAICTLFVTTSCKPSSEKGGKDGGGEQKVTIKGSDTMVHLCGNWAEAFKEKHHGVELAVTGGGSGTGIKALINGTTDICAASRAMKETEEAKLKEKGTPPQKFVVATDGIAVVVNPANSVDTLTQEQIRKIYTGAYKSWSDVGGPDKPIVVLSRESSSGTYVFFQEHVLQKKDYRPDARLMAATSAIITAVSQDEGAIGYVGLGYAVEAGDKVKSLNVKADENSKAVAPSEATVVSGEYSIARPLLLYTGGKPEGLVKEFIDFCLSSEGQKIVAQTGYVPVGSK
ncbi:MAG: phosphate ABC transporter substrate-binding protein [Pirellulales bacterium]|nr:phosphate ABC transporter substrate-binding protein [Pirellulales bacterium]